MNIIENVIVSSKDVLKEGGKLHIGITSSPNTLGRNLLEELSDAGIHQAGGKTFEVRKVHRDVTRYYEGYYARTTGGGWMRGSEGPTWYYIFRLID